MPSKQDKKTAVFKMPGLVSVLIFFLFLIIIYFLAFNIGSLKNISENPVKNPGKNTPKNSANPQQSIEIPVSEIAIASSSASSSDSSSAASGTPTTSTDSIAIDLPIDDPSLTFNSFFDSFASSYLIDSVGSDLYHDEITAAVTFAPDYAFIKADEKIITAAQTQVRFKPLAANDFSYLEAATDERCINNDCLKQRGNKLVYKEKLLAFPEGIMSSQIVALSIGVISVGTKKSEWLVGFTLKEGAGYRGRAYYFDGHNFSRLLDIDKTSNFGLFGFGGETDDFMVIYGSYGGFAYRVKEGKIIDISKFFGYRVMGQGFKPEIIRVKTPWYSNWYIFSSSADMPKLIKLWEDKKGEIAGALFYPLSSIGENRTANFYLLQATAGEVSFLVRSGTGNEADSYQEFIDRGFKNGSAGQLSFVPIKTNSEITIRKLANTGLGAASDAKLLFSSDNNDWRELPIGYYLNKPFNAGPLKEYFLKVIFPAQTDRFFSPFLDEVLFDFYFARKGK